MSSVFKTEVKKKTVTPLKKKVEYDYVSLKLVKGEKRKRESNYTLVQREVGLATEPEDVLLRTTVKSFFDSSLGPNKKYKFYKRSTKT